MHGPRGSAVFRLRAAGAFQNTIIAMREIHARGHRRVGVFVGGTLLMHETVATYWHFAIDHGWPLLSPQVRPGYDTDELAEWIRRERPTVIYTNFPDLYHRIQAAGWSVPRDLGLVLTEVPHHHLPVEPAGINDQPELVFGAMVDTLVAQINHGYCGVPAVRPRTELAGCWLPGRTLPPITPSGRKAGRR